MRLWRHLPAPGVLALSCCKQLRIGLHRNNYMLCRLVLAWCSSCWGRGWAELCVTDHGRGLPLLGTSSIYILGQTSALANRRTARIMTRNWGGKSCKLRGPLTTQQLWGKTSQNSRKEPQRSPSSNMNGMEVVLISPSTWVPSAQKQGLAVSICSNPSSHIELLYLLLGQEHLEQKLQFCMYLQKLICHACLGVFSFIQPFFFLLQGKKISLTHKNPKLMKVQMVEHFKDCWFCGVYGPSGFGDQW